MFGIGPRACCRAAQPRYHGGNDASFAFGAGGNRRFVDGGGLGAATEETAVDFMQLHKVEIAFHEAGTTKNLDLMLSLFADDAVLTAGGKTYTGKDQIKGFWQAAATFQPQNQWVAYTPAFRIRYDVQGDRAHLYFECLYVDKAANSAWSWAKA